MPRITVSEHDCPPSFQWKPAVIWEPYLGKEQRGVCVCLSLKEGKRHPTKCKHQSEVRVGCE